MCLIALCTTLLITIGRILRRCKVTPCIILYVLICVGLARTMYIRCTYGIFSREGTKYTVVYDVHIRFWPTLHMCYQLRNTKIIRMRRDIEHNPHKCLSNNPGGVQASASQPSNPTWKVFLNFVFQVGCCVSLHPLGGAQHKTTSFPNPCVVFTLSVRPAIPVKVLAP